MSRYSRVNVKQRFYDDIELYVSRMTMDDLLACMRSDLVIREHIDQIIRARSVMDAKFSVFPNTEDDYTALVNEFYASATSMYIRGQHNEGNQTFFHHLEDTRQYSPTIIVRPLTYSDRDPVSRNLYVPEKDYYMINSHNASIYEYESIRDSLKTDFRDPMTREVPTSVQKVRFKLPTYSQSQSTQANILASEIAKQKRRRSISGGKSPRTRPRKLRRKRSKSRKQS